MIYKNRVNTGVDICTLPFVTNFQSALPAGTITLFQQTTAPVGWTKLTAHDNKTLRIVTGAVSSGGTLSFTTTLTNKSPTVTANTLAVAATTLVSTQIPLHTHLIGGTTGNHCQYGLSAKCWYQPGSTTARSTGITGGGGSHTHTISGTAAFSQLTLSVQYVDLILAQKN